MRARLLLSSILLWTLAGGCFGGGSGGRPDVAGGEDAADTVAPERLLHVPSPDWRDQVIYFVMIDRFANGDPTNDDQGQGEFDPSDKARWSGGDLQGVIDRLDYIQGLGATAVWITPPVANQWWDPLEQFGGYHGYWARHFERVDEHFGTLDTYKDLSDALHRRGMYLIQDIVPNHVGNYFTYEGSYDPADPTQNVVFNDATVPSTAPEQAPFDQNRVTDPAHRAAAIYHWTPAISDYEDPQQETSYQVSDLDDLNTGNPVVRTALKGSFGYWIREVGVDGFRIDTVRFVEHDFWNDFVRSEDAAAPGVHAVAATTGRDGFLTFGEGFEVGEPGSDAAERFITAFLGTPEKPELDAVLHFPLYKEIDRVFSGGSPTSDLRFRLETFVDSGLFRDPFVTPTFVDNHDVERFVGSGTAEGLQQALLLILTLPGIPVIYYGTEQAFRESRPAMFAGGWGSGGEDHFDASAALYTFLATATAARKANPVLTRGDLTVLRDSVGGPGAFVYRRTHEGATALVVLNTADAPVLLGGVTTGVPAGTVFGTLVRVGPAAVPEPVAAGVNGALTMELPARTGLLLLATDGVVPVVDPPPATITLTTPVEGQTFTGDLTLEGTVTPPTTALSLLVDDYLDGAKPVTVAADGSFAVTLDTSRFPLGESAHTLTLYAPEVGVAGPRPAFTTDIPFDGVILEGEDPVGDDTGPAGTYFYPSDPTFGHQTDIEGWRVEAGAVTMTLRLRMREITTTWNPGQGFDHVAFSVFLDLPDREGLTFLPRLFADAPDGFAWDIGVLAQGWGNNAFGIEGATPDAWGASNPGAPRAQVDPVTRTVSFPFDGQRLGVASWTGVKVYVSTWDWDGIEARYRLLFPEGGTWAFGGGAEDDPHVMDDLPVIEIPPQE